MWWQYFASMRSGSDYKPEAASLSAFFHVREPLADFLYTASALRNVVIGIYVIFINCIKDISFSIIIYL